MNSPLYDVKSLLQGLDRTLEVLCLMVGRLGREAHICDDDIRAGVSDAHLEIITDTADEVIAKTEMIVTESRLGIQTFLSRSDVVDLKNEGSHD